jgi:hypothetical protein
MLLQRKRVCKVGLSKLKKKKKQKLSGQTTHSAVASLDASDVFRPAAHLAPSDVSFVSADKKKGFAVHSFILRMRSAVFAAMLEGLVPGTASTSTSAEPIVLQESGADLQLLFESLYANDPYKFFSGANAVRICKMAHKYACTELLSASYKTAQSLVSKAKFSGGTATQPTIPTLLLLSQETQNTGILKAVLAKGVAFFCSPSPDASLRRCVSHPGEVLPCYYKTPTCRGKVYLDKKAQSTLCQLNPKTLVNIIESLVRAILDKP